MGYEEDRRLEVQRLREGVRVPYPGLFSAGDALLMRNRGMGPPYPGPGDELQGSGEVHPTKGESQTRLVSFIESVVNVGSGFLLSLLLWQFVVAPAFGYEVTMSTNLVLTSIFTVTSVVRGYLWRRFFANDLHRAVVRFVRRMPAFKIFEWR